MDFYGRGRGHWGAAPAFSCLLHPFVSGDGGDSRWMLLILFFN
ncbi:hypothetical protein CBFG_05093 [Clostridiales bacterium 1_7_47FAA]|nr:hypothetical protein CBFG_05093 [Clostridiales bacterium 1_7_47FAA]